MIKQYYLYDSETKKYLSTNDYAEQPENSVDFPPTIFNPEQNAVLNEDATAWIDCRTEEEINKIECPLEVALWKVRVVLKMMQLEDTIANALNNLEEPTKTAGLYIWNYGTAIDRDSQTIAYLQSVLGLTDEQIDNIFIQANLIKL